MLFSLIQIIVVYSKVNISVINDIILVNTTVAVIGVVFATVWAGSGTSSQSRAESSEKGEGQLEVPAVSALVFQSRGGLDGRMTGSATDSSDFNGSYSNGGTVSRDERAKPEKLGIV